MKDLPERPNLRKILSMYEGDTCHVTAGLKNSQQEEQDQHLRHETKDRADTGNDTVYDAATRTAIQHDACGLEQRRRSAPGMPLVPNVP